VRLRAASTREGAARRHLAQPAASPAEIVTSRRSRYLAKPVQSARGDREDAVE
jgi:hypothetical protein